MEGGGSGAGRVLRGAAVGFACATAFTSAVAVREDLPGRPFGVGVPLSVATGIVVGWGAAVAAPWPMPLAAVVVTSRRRGGPETNRAALVCAALGVAGIIGLAIEPNTYHPRGWTPAAGVGLVVHALASGALAGAGIRSWRRRRPASGTVQVGGRPSSR
ncbi:MAG: hypothetical protein ABSG81_13040 [Acidimicrobiales bacterium]